MTAKFFISSIRDTAAKEIAARTAYANMNSELQERRANLRSQLNVQPFRLSDDYVALVMSKQNAAGSKPTSGNVETQNAKSPLNVAVPEPLATPAV